MTRFGTSDPTVPATEGKLKSSGKGGKDCWENHREPQALTSLLRPGDKGKPCHTFTVPGGELLPGPHPTAQVCLVYSVPRTHQIREVHLSTMAKPAPAPVPDFSPAFKLKGKAALCFPHISPSLHVPPATAIYLTDNNRSRIRQ